HRGHLVLDPFAYSPGGLIAQHSLEQVTVVRGGPVAVDEIPAAVEQDFEIREDLEIVDPPRLDPARVDARREFADIGRFPRAHESASGGPFDRIHELRRQGPAAGTAGA